MYYALVDILAILVIFIINFNVLFENRTPNNKKALIFYRLYLLALVIYLVTDAIWGFLYEYHLKTALIVDTQIYFFVMVFSVFAWVHFEVAYLEENKIFNTVLKIVGWVLFASGTTMIIINFFQPLLFYFDENAVYHAQTVRYAFLITQIVVYLLTSVYAFIIAIRSQGEAKLKHITIAAVGNVMSIAILVQIFLPEYPIYAIGCLLGNCLLYSFVMRLETNSYKQKIEEGKVELVNTKELAYTDPLTNIKNKHAYVAKEEEMDLLIREGKIDKFSIIVFDLNNLKEINDTYGHDVGDQYIIKTCDAIKSFFNKDELYRFGGDEFVLIIEDESYAKRYKILEKFNIMIEENIGTDKPVVATGIADFNLGKDNTLRAVFVRADEKMYMRKRSLKEMSNG